MEKSRAASKKCNYQVTLPSVRQRRSYLNLGIILTAQMGRGYLWVTGRLFWAIATNEGTEECGRYCAVVVEDVEEGENEAGAD